MTMTWKLTENEGQRSCSDAGRDVINGCVCAGQLDMQFRSGSVCSCNWPCVFSQTKQN